MSIRNPIAISCGPRLRNHSAIFSGWGAVRINWGGAWPRYQQALDWWAGQRDVERARTRYLKIIFKAANPPRADQYYYTTYGNYIPLDVLENALKISTTANDKAHLNFLIAMTMRYTGGDMSARQRVPDQFEDALAAGKQTDWYDDALFHYAEWMNNYGSYRSLEDGQWQQRPDYVKALELYRRLITEFRKGETRYYDQAQYQIKQITDPSLSIGVSNIFLPGSELEFALNTRNLKRVNLALYKFDMTRDLRFSGLADEDAGEGEIGPWIQKLPLAGRTPFKSWTKNIDEDEPHKPTSEQTRIEGKLPTGAYLLEAKGGALTVRDIVLVSDATLVVKSSNNQVLAFFADAITGAPIANATRRTLGEFLPQQQVAVAPPATNNRLRRARSICIGHRKRPSQLIRDRREQRPAGICFRLCVRHRTE